jgi:hypothetical protein
MKNLLKISTIAFLLIAGVSCENDDQTIASPKGGPQLLTPLNGSAYTLNPANESDEITTLVWNHADYTIQTEVNYTVEVALAGTNFATVFPAGSTTNRFIVWTHEGLNDVALEAGMVPYTAGNLNVRIKSTLGSNNELVAYSNVITLSVTPYTTELPKLAVPGNHQGWSDANSFASAPRVASSGFGQTNYEGYMTLDGGYKFLAPNSTGVFAWGNSDWGQGSSSGVLQAGSQTNCNASSGYYRVKANTTNLTYSATLISSWAVTGSATTLGWPSGPDGTDGQDVDLTYNQSTKKWTGTVTLLGSGEFKFRANNAWSINLGPFRADATGDDYAGENMAYGGMSNFQSPGAGTYLVVLDLSNPRAYTYTLTRQ